MTGWQRQTGFTLLEVLVAITLMGLLASLLAGGLRFGTQVWHDGERRLNSLSAIQSVQGLMRRELSQALPLDLSGDDQDTILFEGEAGYVRFAGPSPSRLMVGGFYDIVIGLSYNDVALQLVMAWRLRSGDLAEGDVGLDETEASDRDQVVLIDDVADVAFAFYGAAEEGGAPQWLDDWVDKNTLPLMVRVMVTFPEDDPRRWPELVVAPKIDLPES